MLAMLDTSHATKTEFMHSRTLADFSRIHPVLHITFITITVVYISCTITITKCMPDGLQREGQFATHLHAAVISQDLHALKQLHHKGADLSAKNSVSCQQPVAYYSLAELQVVRALPQSTNTINAYAS